MARIARLVLLGPTLPLVLAAQTPADLTRAAQVRDRAILTGDMVAWGQLTAAEFTVVDQSGRLFTRANELVRSRQVEGFQLAGQPLIYIDGIRADGVVEGGESAACSDLNFVLSANGGVATRRCHTRAGSKLEVWAKTNLGWQAIVAQYSPAS